MGLTEMYLHEIKKAESKGIEKVIQKSATDVVKRCGNARYTLQEIKLSLDLLLGKIQNRLKAK
jgi:hypothetical protein